MQSTLTVIWWIFVSDQDCRYQTYKMLLWKQNVLCGKLSVLTVCLCNHLIFVTFSFWPSALPGTWCSAFSVATMLSHLQGDLQQLQVQLVQRQLAEPGLALSPALLYGDLTPWAGDSIMLGMLRDVANGKGMKELYLGFETL